MTCPENTTESDYDPYCEEVYLLLNPAEVSVLAVHSIMHGPTPPIGVRLTTWAAMRAGAIETISMHEFSALCDGLGPSLLSDLRDVRQACRPQGRIA